MASNNNEDLTPKREVQHITVYQFNDQDGDFEELIIDPDIALADLLDDDFVLIFVDPQHYQGSCYQAANWQYVGMTTGQGLVRAGKCYETSAKKIFIKPLVKNSRDLLCSQELVGRAPI